MERIRRGWQGGIRVCLLALALAIPTQGADNDANETRLRVSHEQMRPAARTARSAALGGAYTGLSDDGGALFYNPAGLGQSVEGSAQVLYEHNEIDGHDIGSGLDASSSNPGILLVVPVGGAEHKGSLGIAIIRNDLDVPDWGNAEYRTNQFHLGWGSARNCGMHWGVAYTYSTQTTDGAGGIEREADLHTFQGGLLWQLTETVNAGVNGFIGYGYWDDCYGRVPPDEGDVIQMGIGAGASWVILPALVGVMDLRYEYLTADDDNIPEEEETSSLSFHLGVEKRFVLGCNAPEGECAPAADKEIALRAGYHFRHMDYDVRDTVYDDADDTIHAIAVGAGFKMGRMNADYALEWREYGEMAHLFNMGTSF